MAPVVMLTDNPVGVAVYVPAAVPVLVTGWGAVTVLQKGPPYEIVAAGAAVIVTDAVVVAAPHPAAAGIV